LITSVVSVSRARMKYGLYRVFIRLVYVVRRMFRGGGRILSVSVLSLLVLASIVAAMIFSMAAVSGELSRLDLAVFATTLSILASMIPITLAGFGLREGAVVGALTFFGLSATQSAAIAVVYSFCMIMQSLPGAVFWLLPKRLALFELTDPAIDRQL